MNVTQFLVLFSLIFFSFSCFSTDEQAVKAQGEKCAGIKDHTVRLSCYDRLFYSDSNSITDSSITDNPPTNSSPLKQSVLTYKKDNEYTSQNNKIRANNAGKKYLSNESSNTKVIYLSLINIKKNKHQKYVFYFENGQIWQQLEPSYIAKPKQFPIAAHLTSGALNSYNLSIGNKPKKVKVRRVK